MSHLRYILWSIALTIALGAVAGAAPNKAHRAAPKKTHRAVPALPALKAAPDKISAAAAPAGTVETTLYGGQSADQAALTLAPWGGGSIHDSTTLALEGGHSLEVTTVDFYQGAKVTFKTPISLGDMSQTRFLQMTLRFPKAVARTASNLNDSAGGFNNDTSQIEPDPDAPPVVTTLRWVLTLADGKQMEILRPLPTNAPLGHDWVSVSAPLSVLKFPAGDSSPLQSLMVSADGYAVFSIGAIHIVSDTTPITASAGRSQTVNVGDVITLQGIGDGGASALRYTWDFDTADSFVEQAEGQAITTRFFTSGKDYTVTLKVSDLDGIKKPATATTVIHVL